MATYCTEINAFVTYNSGLFTFLSEKSTLSLKKENRRVHPGNRAESTVPACLSTAMERGIERKKENKTKLQSEHYHLSFGKMVRC